MTGSSEASSKNPFLHTSQLSIVKHIEQLTTRQSTQVEVVTSTIFPSGHVTKHSEAPVEGFRIFRIFLFSL